MHPFQILLVRQTITASICFIWAFAIRHTARAIPDFPLGPKSAGGRVRALLLCRGVCGFMGVFGMYFSLLYLPLSEATVLTFLAPIATCYLCSWVLPGESGGSFGRQQQIAAGVSLLGVVFIARPFSFLGSTGDGAKSAQEALPAAGEQAATPTASEHLMAIGISLIGVVGATGAMTSIRAIGNRAHPFLSINYFSTVCVIMSLICTLVFPGVSFRLPDNATEWGLLSVLGGAGFIMQYLLTAGLAYGSGGQGYGSDGSGHEDGSISLEAQGGEARDVEGIDIELPQRKRSRHAKGKGVSYSSSIEGPIKGSGTRATSMVYTQMLFALAGDKLVFGLTPGVMSWIGSALILAGAIWVASAS